MELPILYSHAEKRFTLSLDGAKNRMPLEATYVLLENANLVGKAVDPSSEGKSRPFVRLGTIRKLTFPAQ